MFVVRILEQKRVLIGDIFLSIMTRKIQKVILIAEHFYQQLQYVDNN
jgi:hypothetical protein